MKHELASLPVIAVLMAGCATVTRGTTEQVTFTSEPAGAAVETTSGLRCAATPCTFDIARKSEFSATFLLPGYEEQKVDVVAELAGNGAAGFAGNVLIGGVVGMGADAATGATLDHRPNPVHAVMIQVKSPEKHQKAPKRGPARTTATEPTS